MVINDKRKGNIVSFCKGTFYASIHVIYMKKLAKS